MRSLVWATALVVTSSVAVAQPLPEVKDGKQVFAITLSPMAAPKPLSNYYLTPQYKEQQPGDQLSGFMKSTMARHAFFSTEPEKLREKFNELTLEELPKDSRQQASIMAGIAYPGKYRGMMANMDLAARYTRTEWNDYFHVREDGIGWLLPEVQYMRNIASVLNVRLRGEIKNGEFDRAIVTVRSMTGLARMFETHPSIIGNLVGISIQMIAWNRVEEMIAQPGCPNLFWSLVELPNPPHTIARGYEGERTFMTSELDYLLTLERPLTGPEESKCLAFFQQLIKEESPEKDGVDKSNTAQEKLTRFVADKARVEAARGRLVSVGKMKPEAVKGFSPMQVTMTDDVLTYHILRDEMLKYRNLPFDVAFAGMEAQEKLFQAAKPETVVAPALMTVVKKVKVAEVRLAQRVALLRILEALRLHAAAANGELPATLADTKLPMPLDPVTGKAFEYGVKDGVAMLTGGVIPGTPQRVYEVRLRK
jgi:hypothetical protein